MGSEGIFYNGSDLCLMKSDSSSREVAVDDLVVDLSRELLGNTKTYSFATRGGCI